MNYHRQLGQSVAIDGQQERKQGHKGQDVKELQSVGIIEKRI